MLSSRPQNFPIEDHAENGAVTPEEILDHRPRVLSQAQREFFFAQGYLLVERAIDAAQLTRLREAFAMLETRGEEPECPADFEFETLPDGGRRLRQVLCAADYHPEIWSYVSNAPMTELAADVVGPNVQSANPEYPSNPRGGEASAGTRTSCSFLPVTALPS